jgi:8-oxoguanine deaminase
MTSLLIRQAAWLVAMDEADSRWAGGGLYVVDNVIRQVGPSSQLPQDADQTIDARDMLILPGMVTIRSGPG